MHIIIMLVLISLLIIVHELGHFLAAKACGLRVSKFGIGLPFGPTLYKKKFGKTTFIVHSLLLGGYVSFPDDNAPENRDEFNDEEETLPQDSPLLFKNKNGFQQAFILTAGVLCNFIFAVVLIFATALYFGKLPSGGYDVLVAGTVPPANTSNIIKKGIKKGDKIILLNGIEINSPQKFFFIVQNSKPYNGYADKTNADKIFNEILNLNQAYNKNTIFKKGDKVILPKPLNEPSLKVDELVAAGLKSYHPEGFKLNSLQRKISHNSKGKTIFIIPEEISIKNLSQSLADAYMPLEMTVLRGDKKIKFEDVIPDENGILGIKMGFKQNYAPTTTPKSAFLVSMKYLSDNTRLMVSGLYQLVTGKISIKDMHGIVAITKIGGDIIENRGFLEGLLLTALISINLALFNILPIPALDGGMLFFLIIEKITGKKFDEKVMEKINSGFFYALVLLMIFIVFNDIFAIISKKF